MKAEGASVRARSVLASFSPGTSHGWNREVTNVGRRVACLQTRRPQFRDCSAPGVGASVWLVDGNVSFLPWQSFQGRGPSPRIPCFAVNLSTRHNATGQLEEACLPGSGLVCFTWDKKSLPNNRRLPVFQEKLPLAPRGKRVQ